tara:strand:- start:2359 stop:3354 length:996 start_codon:yes stop_codon:yes gene_type:complete
MSKKVLITGGAGFIGLHLANRLLDEGYQVDLVDNFSRAVDDQELKAIVSRKKVRSYTIDLLEEKESDVLDNDYDYIFHLAAIIGVIHVMNKPYNVLFDNIQMLGNIIKFTKRLKNLSRFFFASTSEVYAGTLKHFELPIPTPEVTPLAITDLSHPRTSYMLSKIYGEALCLQAGIPYTVFRPHNVYGPRMGMAHVVPELLKKAYLAEDGDHIEVFSIEHTRCFCYIDDAIEILWRMIINESCEGKTLNLGTQNPEISVKEVAETCFRVVGKDLVIDSLSPLPGSPARRGPDMRQTKKLINYESQVGLEEGVQKTYTWYKNNIFEGDQLTAK